jgi:hypothetical protein
MRTRGQGPGAGGRGSARPFGPVFLRNARTARHLPLTPVPRLPAPRAKRASGNAVLEFALLYGTIILPLTFMLIFVSEMAWIWHSVVDFTRDGARYAATHCFESDGSAGNVLAYMESNVPIMIDQGQFQSGAAGIQISYFSQNPDGSLAPFDPTVCGGTLCLPDSVSVAIRNYQFTRFSSFFKLPAVTIPPFTTTVPMESAGYQDATGACVP